MSNPVPFRYYKTEYRREGQDTGKYPYGERSEIVSNMIPGAKITFASGDRFRIVDVEFDLTEHLTYTMIVWMKEVTE